MWIYAIMTEWGECLESGGYDDREAMRRHCESRVKHWKSAKWWYSFDEEEEQNGDK